MLSQLKKTKLQSMARILACLVSFPLIVCSTAVQVGGPVMDKAANVPSQETMPLLDKVTDTSIQEQQNAIDPAYEMPVVEYVDMPMAAEASVITDDPAPPPVQVPKFQGKIPRSRNPIVNRPPRIDQACTGCVDILMGGQIYSDPSVNMVYSYVYSLCLMEWVMQRYLKSQKYVQFKDNTQIESQESALSEIQRILPSYLMAFSMLVNAFKNENFRKEIDILRQKATSVDNGVNLRTPAT
jgi:hypothetical protein